MRNLAMSLINLDMEAVIMLLLSELDKVETIIDTLNNYCRRTMTLLPTPTLLPKLLTLLQTPPL